MKIVFFIHFNSENDFDYMRMHVKCPTFSLSVNGCCADIVSHCISSLQFLTLASSRVVFWWYEIVCGLSYAHSI